MRPRLPANPKPKRLPKRLVKYLPILLLCVMSSLLPGENTGARGQHGDRAPLYLSKVGARLDETIRQGNRCIFSPSQDSSGQMIGIADFLGTRRAERRCSAWGPEGDVAVGHNLGDGPCFCFYHIHLGMAETEQRVGV